jgi:type II secretory pathway component GspD/PulD (secretin)
MVGTVVKLRTAKAQAVAAQLARLAGEGGSTFSRISDGGLAGITFPSNATVAPVPGENAVLIYAEESVAKTLANAARRYDEQPDGGTVLKGEKPQADTTVLRLRHVSADEAAKVIGEVFNGPGRDGNRVRVTSDAASNSLLVQGSPADIETIRKVLDKVIDAAPAKEPEPKLSLLHLSDGTATAVAEALTKEFKNRPNVRVTPHSASNQLLIYADDATLAEIRDFISKLTATNKADEVKRLESDVEAQRDRVAWAERQVKLGHITPSQAEVERAKLQDAENKLAVEKRRLEDWPAVQKSLVEAINAQKEALRLMESVKGADPREVEEMRTLLNKYQRRLNELKRQLGGK